jgi:hypothetical protein
VFIFVDAEVPSEILEPHGRLAPRKLLFRSVVLEPSFHEARRIPDPEAVRGDMHLAPLFREACILLDPHGRLESLATAGTPPKGAPVSTRSVPQAVPQVILNVLLRCLDIIWRD